MAPRLSSSKRNPCRVPYPSDAQTYVSGEYLGYPLYPLPCRARPLYHQLEDREIRFRQPPSQTLLAVLMTT